MESSVRQRTHLQRSMRSYKENTMIRFSGRRMLPATALVLLAGALSVGAVQGQVVNPVGKPKGYKAGATIRYAVWNDGQGWHLGTATAGKLHRFQGSVEVIGGRIIAFTPQQLEGGGKTSDYWMITSSRRKLYFDFSTKGAADGVLFQVGPTATALKFDLNIDGKSQPQLIHLGQNAVHPGSSTFTLPAFPR